MPEQIVIDEAALQRLLAQYTEWDSEAQSVLGPWTWPGPATGDLAVKFPVRVGNIGGESGGGWPPAQTFTQVADALRGVINDRLKAYGANLRILHYGTSNVITMGDHTETLNKMTIEEYTGLMPQE
jgi:hypothetical protein